MALKHLGVIYRKLNNWMIIAVIYATKAVAKRKPEKNSGLNGIRTHDLCDIPVHAVLWSLCEFVIYPSRRWDENKVIFRLSFRNCLSCVYNCDDHSLIHSFSRSSNVWIFIYSLSYRKLPFISSGLIYTISLGVFDGLITRGANIVGG